MEGQENKFCLLRKALYGLKQAPRAWLEGEFTKVSLYVDDLLIMGSSSIQLEKFKMAMHNEFEMTDLGEMSYFLGMEIHQSQHGIFVSQKKFANEILHKFDMDRCKPVDTLLVANLKLSKDDGAVKIDEKMYRSLIGCLLYLTATRPDLMLATSILSRFMSSPSEIHLKATKRVLRYIKGSVELGVWFKKTKNLPLIGYSDSDRVRCINDMRSTSGYVFFLNSGAICWLSKKQDTISESIVEA
ncbi:uncharacterized protein LOC116136136 [Pistacia vera]|uniref:uncharacterized protein LOC116136136 n=1 Tax=Pistacia vera TaxID=55513 RepID=UPI0012633911|nr:uncharacterized protein LOC116136136 [Pistacia vera]